MTLVVRTKDNYNTHESELIDRGGKGNETKEKSIVVIVVSVRMSFGLGESADYTVEPKDELWNRTMWLKTYTID